MFIGKEDGKTGGLRRLSRWLWTVAWLFQAALWAFTLFLIADYWLYELPSTKNYYAAGLEQGFDGLAGIIAVMAPGWEETRSLRGLNVPNRLNRLQGDTVFNVWLERDEMPGWHAGLGQLRFDGEGRLLWVRRLQGGEDLGEGLMVVRPRTEVK
ncbi:MAG: hypothetical protein FWF99_04105 [Desulfovibrionaceae bacterium]|nr:hypothetical protein [Desulfovibrionaceae bacterium]